jgi:DUF971 family protein
MQPAFDPRIRPIDLTVDRAAQEFRVTWQDGQTSVYPLVWLRDNCPCAECSEKRHSDGTEKVPGLLNLELPPSYEVVNAALIGNYAIQFEWTDGHYAGIYAFTDLRRASEEGGFDPDKLPPMQTGRE